MKTWATQVKEQIRRRYSRLAVEDTFPPGGADRVLEAGYPAAWANETPEAILGSYSGCGFLLEGVDVADARLAVDLGCGAGLDARLIADRMKAGSLLIALDFTEAMLARARDAADPESDVATLPVCGDMEQLPLADASVDLVFANASFNLTLDKQAAFAEAARILQKGGWLLARDMVRVGELPSEVLQDPLSSSTSLGGAVEEADLRAAIADAGFTDILIDGHQPFSYLTSVRIEARKPN